MHKTVGRAGNPRSQIWPLRTKKQRRIWFLRVVKARLTLSTFNHFLNLDEVGKVKLCHYKTFTTPMNWTKLDRRGKLSQIYPAVGSIQRWAPPKTSDVEASWRGGGWLCWLWWRWRWLVEVEVVHPFQTPFKRPFLNNFTAGSPSWLTLVLWWHWFWSPN